MDYFNRFREKITEFKKIRQKDFFVHPHYRNEYYMDCTVRLMNICLGVDDASHGKFTVWFYLLPGEEPEQFKKRFEKLLKETGDVGNYRTEWMPRFLLASQLEEMHPFINCLKDSFVLSTGRMPKITGAPMCDMGFVNHYGKFPCVMFGLSRMEREGMFHQPDEYIEITEFIEHLKIVVFCIMNWCGYTIKGTGEKEKC